MTSSSVFHIRRGPLAGIEMHADAGTGDDGDAEGSVPWLVPTPQRLELLGGRASCVGRPTLRWSPGWNAGQRFGDDDTAWCWPEHLAAGGVGAWAVEIRHDGAFEPQQYRLRLDGSGAVLHAGDADGVRWGLVTLGQLLRQYGGSPPAMEISDGPAVAVRGAMLDVSRDRVPTMPELFRMVDELARLKINHLQLYTEHTFAYAGHEAAWKGWSPLTPAEIRRLDEHCRTRGVELAANQNCFGHLASWLRLPEYANLAETHGDWMFDVWPRSGPFSLCPTDPASLEFVDGLLEQLLPCFTSGMVNIGCDETYDIAYGRSREEVAKRGRAAVYMEFVSRVCERVRKRGRKPMFWADIVLHEPESVSSLPPDLVSLAWGYEPHSPFVQWVELLAKAQRPVWVCPGTSSWRSITGRTAERTGNLDGACQAVRSGGGSVGGFLMCDWGDTGHHQTWPIALTGLAHGAAAAWTGNAAVGGGASDGHRRLDPRALSLQVFGDRSGVVGGWLLELGDADAPLRRVAGRLSRPRQSGEFALWNQSALFADLHNCAAGALAEVGELRLWTEAGDRLADLRRRLPVVGGPGGRLLKDELRHTLDVADLAARRAVLRRRALPATPLAAGEAAASCLSDAERVELLERLEAVVAEHRRLWGVRARPGGLGHSVGFYDKVRAGL
ncbi:MAG: family 20 glycosylhydrolase [bacterium]|jgi:hexosaminidase